MPTFTAPCAHPPRGQTNGPVDAVATAAAAVPFRNPRLLSVIFILLSVVAGRVWVQEEDRPPARSPATRGEAQSVGAIGIYGRVGSRAIRRVHSILLPLSSSPDEITRTPRARTGDRSRPGLLPTLVPARITGIPCEMRARTMAVIDRHLSSGDGDAEALRTRRRWINSAQAAVSVCQMRSQELSRAVAHPLRGGDVCLT
jgi:hypothetical protein